MFASKSVARHLVRGAVGMGAFVGAGLLVSTHPLGAVLLVAIGLMALRGCPTCWLIGLIQTVAGRKSSCPDGSCAPSDKHR